MLSSLFRGKMLASLKAAHDAGRLQFFTNHAELAGRSAFKAWLETLYDTDWHVYTKRRSPGPKPCSPTWGATRTALRSQTAA